MSKLALLALVIGAGACVADDPSTTSARVTDTEVAAFNVINEVELPTVGEDTIDTEIVVVTGLDYPGHTPLQPNIDLANVETRTLNPEGRAICAAVESLPNSDVCSSLCDPHAFTARVFEGSTGCTQQTCNLPGGATINVDVCN